MTIEKFEDIMIWQRAKNLTIDIYKLFESQKDFSFKSQIQRASVSDEAIIISKTVSNFIKTL